MESNQQLDKLIEACQKGDLDGVIRRLKTEPELLHETRWYLRPLHFAAREGHADVVDYLLSAGANPAPPEEVAVAPRALELARLKGDDRIVELLAGALKDRFNTTEDCNELCKSLEGNDFSGLEKSLSADPSLARCADEAGNTPLHWAVFHNNQNAVDCLLDCGADIDARRADGKTPSILALYKHDWWMNRFRDQNTSMLEHLLERGAQYSILLAAAKGDRKRVAMLLGENPDLVDYCDPCNKRPLSCAAEAGHIEIVELLLKRGADPDASEALCQGGGYALYGAVWGNHVDCVKMLLDCGANPNVEVDSSGNPLAISEGKEEIRQMLTAHGAKPIACLAMPSYEDESSLAAIDSWLAEHPDNVNDAIYIHRGRGEEHEKGQREIVKLLFKHGADPQKCPLYVLHHALTKLPSVGRQLLECGVSSSLRCGITGTTIQHSIAECGDRQAMETLLEFNTDLSARDFEYRSTPLAWAVRAGQKSMVDYLLENGAAVHLPDDEEWTTPIFWARRSAHQEIEKCLAAYDV